MPAPAICGLPLQAARQPFSGLPPTSPVPIVRSANSTGSSRCTASGVVVVGAGSGPGQGRQGDVERQGTTSIRGAADGTGDALVSASASVALCILVADCAPVALASPEGVFAAVHAGWRGLADGVVAAAVEAMVELGASGIEGALGPCVHPCCYEFSEKDLAGLVEAFGPEVRGRMADGRPALDLPAAVGMALEQAGVDHGRPGGTVYRLRWWAVLPPGTSGAGTSGDDRLARRGRGHRPGEAVTSAGPTAVEVADRVAEVRRRIASAAPDPASVAVVAVTKGFGPEAVRAALSAGISDIGENYASELLEKAKALTPDEQPVWHFLGAVQRNKVARLAPVVGCWQSVSPSGRGDGHRPAMPWRGRPGPGGHRRPTGPARPGAREGPRARDGAPRRRPGRARAHGHRPSWAARRVAGRLPARGRSWPTSSTCRSGHSG